jgi:hypothetical protein
MTAIVERKTSKANSIRLIFLLATALGTPDVLRYQLVGGKRLSLRAGSYLD